MAKIRENADADESNTVDHPAPFVESEATLAEHPGNTVPAKAAEAE